MTSFKKQSIYTEYDMNSVKIQLIQIIKMQTQWITFIENVFILLSVSFTKLILFVMRQTTINYMDA